MDEEAIKKALATYVKSWNKDDMNALATAEEPLWRVATREKQ